MPHHRSVFALFALIPFVAFARQSAPDYRPISDPIPAPRDVPRPGVITLSVDATDVLRGIFNVTEQVPVEAAGPVTLLYPEWLPGHHSTTDALASLAGLTISAGGQTLPWKRDAVDLFAFHVDVPAHVDRLDLRFQFLAPTAPNQGRIVTAPDMLDLEWNAVSLYPAGYYVRLIQVAASARYPAGWRAVGALEVGSRDGDTIHYKTVSYDTLVDSPVMAGANVRVETLSPDVRLDVVADAPEQLGMTDAQLQLHRNLVVQALKLFGAQHYDHYDFLLALSDVEGSIGLEHHRSSEDGVDSGYFIEWKDDLGDRNLLPHEYTHSWNGKYRRPADLWTPDYRVPMQGSLLWVYEGQTQFWGYVLEARSGLASREEVLGALANIAASLDSRVGRRWRPLLDTTNDPSIAKRRPKAWMSWQRAEDYYNEGLLVWLDVDSLIRERSGGKRSLDDFARAFFGVNDGDWGELTYTFDDLVRTLDRVEPYDWAAFLHARLDNVGDHAPLDGITRGGYRLVYSDTPTEWYKANEKKRKFSDLGYSGGFVITKEGEITEVIWDSPAFNAGLTVGSKVLAVDGRAFDIDRFKAELKTKKSVYELLVKSGDVFRTITLNYGGGLRYPRLEKTGAGPSTLDQLLTPRS